MEVKKVLSQSSQACAWITVKFSVSIMVCLTQDGCWTCLEHFVMLEMMPESGGSGTKGTWCTSWHAQAVQSGWKQEIRRLHARHMDPNVSSCQGKTSMWAKSPRRAHVNDYPFSDEESGTQNGGPKYANPIER